MSSSLSCPQCGQQVSIPPFAAPSAQVRCPLCSGQYSLQTALENLPPMLVLVEAAETVSADEDIFSRPPKAAPVATAFAKPLVSPTDHDDDLTSSDKSTPSLDDIDFSAPLSTAEELDALATDPNVDTHGDDHPSLDIEADFDELTPDFGAIEDFDAATEHTRSDGTLDLSQGAFGGMSDEAADAELELETELEELDAESHEFEPEDVPRNEPSFVASDTKGDKSETSKLDLKTTPRKKRREPSMIGNLIGVVGGGGIGLGMGYLILLWVGGPKMDQLNLAPSLPKWMLPAAFSQAAPNKKVVLADAGTQAAPNQTLPPTNEPANDPLPLNVPQLEGDSPESTTDPLATPELPMDEPSIDPLGPVTPPVTKKPTKPAVDPTDELPADEMPADEMPADETPADDLPADEMPADEPANEVPPVKPAKTTVAEIEPPADEPAETETPVEPADEMPADTDVASNTKKPDPLAPSKVDDEGDDEMPADEAPATDVPATDVPAADEKVGPREAAKFTLADLGQATKDVRTVVKELADPSALDKDAFTKLRNQFYRKFSHLGYVLTSTADDPSAPRLSGHREAIQQVVLESADDDKKFAEIGRAAGKWIAMPLAKRGDPGIMLSGTVESVEPVGRLFETKVNLPGGQQVIRLLSDKKPAAAPADRLVVIGSIVEAPSKDLVGYDGADEAVVWTGLAVILPPATE